MLVSSCNATHWQGTIEYHGAGLKVGLAPKKEFGSLENV